MSLQLNIRKIKIKDYYNREKVLEDKEVSDID